MFCHFLAVPLSDLTEYDVTAPDATLAPEYFASYPELDRALRSSNANGVAKTLLSLRGLD